MPKNKEKPPFLIQLIDKVIIFAAKTTVNCHFTMLSNEIKAIIPTIQLYLSQQPVEKAWLFGSCSRGEERADSDVDILVQYRSGERITLFTICRIALDLESQINRPVDLIEAGRLLPFAQESAEHDKILIYERAA